MSHKVERCGSMQYHRPHDYRTARGEPQRCDGLPVDAADGRTSAGAESHHA